MIDKTNRHPRPPKNDAASIAMKFVHKYWHRVIDVTVRIFHRRSDTVTTSIIDTVPFHCVRISCRRYR